VGDDRVVVPPLRTVGDDRVVAPVPRTVGVLRLVAPPLFTVGVVLVVVEGCEPPLSPPGLLTLEEGLVAPELERPVPGGAVRVVPAVGRVVGTVRA
jgi:hypothetical protein